MSEEEPSMPTTTPLLILRVFGNMVEQNDMEIGVTMLVSGQWVSGMLTSTRRYVDALTTSLRQGARDETAEAFVEGFGSALEDSVVAELLEAPAEERVHGPEVFLRKARVWIDDDAVDHVVLAVRTDRVDAIYIGNPYTMPED